MDPAPSKPPMSLPPEVWGPAHSLALRIVRPVERFLHVQAASGAVLLVMAVVALVWANSPWGHLYDALWHTPVVLGIGPFTFTQSLHFWINDGLMTIFFFVVGLEIRREIYQGELSELKRATLPIAAAVGGMIAPALIYLALNPTGPERRGWGVPMATDIAFAVGVLALLGDRVKPALRVLLLALAIIDDIGAILVIAIFYSGGVSLFGLGLAAGGGAIVLFGLFITWSTRSIREHGERVANVSTMTTIVGVGLCIAGGYLLVRGRAIARERSPAMPVAPSASSSGRSCPRCNADVPRAATFCPTCGHALP